MPIEEINTNSVSEFWETISPTGNFISGMRNPIFRGQGDSCWPLTPSVLRKEIISTYESDNWRSTQIDQIVHFEYFLLFDFLHYLDKMRFTIPNDSTEFRKHMEFSEFTNRYGTDGVGWPSKEYFSFIALAQHHGIPTRLLDWTKDQYVGAYFATSQVLNLKDKPERLAIWVVDSNVLKILRGKLEYLELPAETSKFMTAQKGVFLIHRQQNGMGRSSSFSSEELKYVVNKLFEENEKCTAYKVTLPASMAGDLLFKCNVHGVSAATLFPDLNGAARAALEYKMAKKLSDRL